VVPGLDSHALLDALAIHVPAGTVPLPAPGRGERTARTARPEFELVDTGIFDDGRYFEITADYAKASPDDILVEVSVRNHGPDQAELHLLPTLWFRNTWSWDADHHRPEISAEGGS